MIEQSCPWCEAVLLVDAESVASDVEQTCPECLTKWVLEDEAEYELALAA